MKQLLLAFFIPALVQAQPENKPGSGNGLRFNRINQNVGRHSSQALQVLITSNKFYDQLFPF